MRRVYEFLRSKLILTSVVKQSRVIIERLVKQRFNISKLGVTFRNSKWVNYIKTNTYTTQVNLTLFFYSFITFFILPFLTSCLLFGMDYTLHQFVLLKSHIDSICVFIVSYSTLIWTFLKTKVVDNFIKTNFEAANGLERFRNDGNRSLEPIVNVLEGCRNVGPNDHQSNLEHSVILLQQAYQIADCLRTLDDHSKIVAIKRLSRAPLSDHWDLPGTSENSDIWLLKMWSDVERSKYKSPYIFNGGLDYNQWSLDRILQDLNFSSSIIEQAHVNENYKIRKIPSIKGLSALIFTLQDMNSLVKTKRWLYKYSMLHNKSVISAFNVVSVKKLLYPFSFTQDMFTKNFWLFNTLNLSQDLKRSSYIKNNYFANVLHANNSFPFIQESKVRANVNYELSYYWFLKRLYFLNSSNFLDTKVTGIIVSDLHQSLSGSNALGYFHQGNTFLKITTPLQKLGTHAFADVSETKDIFYHPVNAVFYNQNVLATSYAILSNRDISNTGSKHFVLSDYSWFLNESLTESEKTGYATYIHGQRYPKVIGRFKWTYWSFLRHYVSELNHIAKKKKPNSVVCGDFMSSEYTKDVYRLITKS
jgi:hypothetical protein